MRSAAAALLLALGLFAPSARAAPEKMQSIKVVPGDTLWSIAQRYLKDPRRWNVVLRNNKLPTSDPTVALPGMTLQIPTDELKERFQAAILMHMERSVSFRESESPAWSSARQKMELFEDWGLRTQDQSWARVQFHAGAVLSLDPNSMAILKSPKRDNNELELKRGAIHTTLARVVTPSARIVPKGGDTKYTARILDDLSTRVQVYKGAADVQDVKGTKSVEVKAGYYTSVPLDRAPATPSKMPNVDMAMAPEVQDFAKGSGDSVVKMRAPRAPGQGVTGLAADIAALSVGVPVAAYRIQMAKDSSFSAGAMTLDKTFDPESEMKLPAAARSAKTCYYRAAIIDLLGEQGKWSEAKPCPRKDEDFASLSFAASLEVIRPEEEEVKVKVPRYRVMGRASKELNVLINGERVSKDEDGMFSTEVMLKAGPNNFRIEASDVQGNDKVLIRRVVYEP
ncbi:MAG: FecR domain-containing protein [Elusimicrobia bacterium]|nr:FecR domain-containing protein [Elusimicrobiota bacterium]